MERLIVSGGVNLGGRSMW